MKTKFLVVLVMLFSFSCMAYEPGTTVSKSEVDSRGYQVTNRCLVQPDGTLKLIEEDTLSKAERYFLFLARLNREKPRLVRGSTLFLIQTEMT